MRMSVSDDFLLIYLQSPVIVNFIELSNNEDAENVPQRELDRVTAADQNVNIKRKLEV